MIFLRVIVVGGFLVGADLQTSDERKQPWMISRGSKCIVVVIVPCDCYHISAGRIASATLRRDNRSRRHLRCMVDDARTANV